MMLEYMIFSFVIRVFLEIFRNLNNFLKSDIPVYLWIKLGFYFASERKVILVSNEMVPMGLIEGRNEPPSRFTNTFQVLDIVTLNRFVKDVFLHSSERFFDMFDIRR